MWQWISSSSKENILELLNLLPDDVRDIAKDEDKVGLFKEVKELDREDIPLVIGIIRILNKNRRLREEERYADYPLLPEEEPSLAIAEKRAEHGAVNKGRKKKSK